MASPHCASGAENLRPTTVSHMPHRCSSAHDVLLGPHPGTKCLSQARHTCHRAELSTRMELDLKSCPWTPAAPKGPPPPPFRTNNLVRSRVRSSPASHHGTGISVSRQGAPTLPRRSTQPRLRRSHYPEPGPRAQLPPWDSVGRAGLGAAQGHGDASSRASPVTSD